MNRNVEDDDVTLVAGSLRCKVSPFGASLHGLQRKNVQGQFLDIVSTYMGAQNKVGGQGDVLIPFPGRIRGGHYTFEGHEYQLDMNDKESPSAIHGFLRSLPWEATNDSETSVTFVVSLNAADHPGYPFSLQVAVTYLLEATGLTCRFTIENKGDNAAPVAAGFHPYFTVGSDLIDADTLRVPMKSFMEFENLLPTGRILPVEGTAYDFRQPHAIGETKFNTCYMHPNRDEDSLVRIRLTSGHSGGDLTIWMDAAFDYVVLYSGDPLPESHRRRMLAIEPMTCATDAFNNPEWGLIALDPGKSVSGSWGVTI